MTTPNKHIPYAPEGTLDPAAGINDALDFIDALLQTAVLAMDLTAPPGGAANGDLYIVAGTGGTATGLWAGHENDLARYVSAGGFWQFFEAGSEVAYVLNREDGEIYLYGNGSPAAWEQYSAGGGGGGISDAPSDGEQYARQDGAWEVVDAIPDAPSDGQQYARQDGSWAVVESGGGSPGGADVPWASLYLPNKEWRAIAAAALQGIGATTPAVTGTATSPSKAGVGGGIFGYMSLRRQTSATTANAVAAFRSQTEYDSVHVDEDIGSLLRVAGFYCRMRFGTGTILSDQRFFAGLCADTAIDGSSDPSNQIQCIGVGKDSGDANFQIMHNAPTVSGVATKIDTGLAFAASKWFELEIYEPITGVSGFMYRLVDLDTGDEWTGTLTTDIPNGSLQMYWRVWASTGPTGGSAVQVDVHYVGIRYPL